MPIAVVLELDGEVRFSSATSEVRDKRFLVHAELNTLLEADKGGLTFSERKRATLYTTLEPCLMCLGSCLSFFLGGVTYALASPGDGAVNLTRKWKRAGADLPNYQMPSIRSGLLEAEFRELFREYVRRHQSGAMWEWARTVVSE